jgi:hypothetical protein
VRGLVDSLLVPTELRTFRLAWVTPDAPHLDQPDAAWIGLRLTVAATNDETYSREIWGPGWPTTWDDALDQLANDLEDWVCETAFAWGEQRKARVPD